MEGTLFISILLFFASVHLTHTNTKFMLTQFHLTILALNISLSPPLHPLYIKIWKPELNFHVPHEYLWMNARRFSSSFSTVHFFGCKQAVYEYTRVSICIHNFLNGHLLRGEINGSRVNSNVGGAGDASSCTGSERILCNRGNNGVCFPRFAVLFPRRLNREREYVVRNTSFVCFQWYFHNLGAEFRLFPSNCCLLQFSYRVC